MGDAGADGARGGELKAVDPAEIAYEPNRGLAVLLVTDDPVRRDALARLAAGHGARLAGSATIAEAEDRIAAAGTWIVLADLRGAGEAASDRALVALARRPAGGSLAIVDGAALDLAYGRLAGTPVDIVVAPTAEELAAAAAALLGQWSGVAEGGRDASARTLAELGEEVGRIARVLASLSDDARAGAQPARGGDPAQRLAQIRGILRARRLRDQHFDAALFADPAWDMLLDLAAAAIEGRRVAVSSLCIASAVPPTTALRWITTMTERGLFRRESDPQDGRRIFIALTDAATAAMTAYLEASARAADRG